MSEQLGIKSIIRGPYTPDEKIELIQSQLTAANERIKELEGRLSKIVDVGTGVPFSEGRVSIFLDKLMECKEIAEGV